MEKFNFSSLTDYLDNPYKHFAKYRESDPIHWGSPLTPNASGAWYLFRHKDCAEVLKDPRFGKDVPRIIREYNVEFPDIYKNYIEHFKDAIVFKDPPEHTRLRASIHKAFFGRALNEMTGRIAETVAKMLEPLKGRTEIDVVEDFAFPFPVAVICDILGTPVEDRARFRDWTMAFTRALAGSRDPRTYETAIETLGETKEYLTHLVARRRRQPENDLISQFAASNESEGGLSEPEILTMCYALLSGGHETSTNVFASAIYHLLKNPDQLEQLQKSPELMENAVHEFLRYETPVQYTFRFAYEDVELDDRVIRKGDRVMIMLASACRDPEVFENPEALDVRRVIDAKSIHFGRGPHHCVGSALSPLELNLSLGAFLKMFPKLALKEQPFEWSGNFQFRGLKKLQVTLQ
jgi:hypothetical protein